MLLFLPLAMLLLAGLIDAICPCQLCVECLRGMLIKSPTEPYRINCHSIVATFPLLPTDTAACPTGKLLVISERPDYVNRIARACWNKLFRTRCADGVDQRQPAILAGDIGCWKRTLIRQDGSNLVTCFERLPG